MNLFLMCLFFCLFGISNQLFWPLAYVQDMQQVVNRCYNSFEEPIFFPLVAVPDAVLLVPFCTSSSDDKLRARVQVAQALNSQHKESMFREGKIQRSKWSLTWLKALFDILMSRSIPTALGMCFQYLGVPKYVYVRYVWQYLKPPANTFCLKAVILDAMLSFYFLIGRLWFSSSLSSWLWKSDVFTDLRPASSWVSRCHF